MGFLLALAIGCDPRHAESDYYYGDARHTDKNIQNGIYVRNHYYSKKELPEAANAVKAEIDNTTGEVSFYNFKDELITTIQKNTDYTPKERRNYFTFRGQKYESLKDDYIDTPLSELWRIDSLLQTAEPHIQSDICGFLINDLSERRDSYLTYRAAAFWSAVGSESGYFEKAEASRKIFLENLKSDNRDAQYFLSQIVKLQLSEEEKSLVYQDFLLLAKETSDINLFLQLAKTFPYLNHRNTWVDTIQTAAAVALTIPSLGGFWQLYAFYPEKPKDDTSGHDNEQHQQKLSIDLKTSLIASFCEFYKKNSLPAKEVWRASYFLPEMNAEHQSDIFDYCLKKASEENDLNTLWQMHKQTKDEKIQDKIDGIIQKKLKEFDSRKSAIEINIETAVGILMSTKDVETAAVALDIYRNDARSALYIGDLLSQIPDQDFAKKLAKTFLERNGVSVANRDPSDPIHNLDLEKKKDLLPNSNPNGKSKKIIDDYKDLASTWDFYRKVQGSNFHPNP